MEQVSPATPALIDGRPEWDRISEEISCPLCEYNLRGLTEPQCPECGYRFQWPDLLDATRRVHPYLFEFHPNRNIRSFCKTAWRGLRPTRFWSTLRPSHRCIPGRLRVYWIIVAEIVLYAFAAQAAVVVLRYNLDQAPTAYTTYILPVPNNMSPLSRIAHWQLPPWDLDDWGGVIIPAAIVLAWPLLTYWSLLIFRASMWRAKVKQAHVLRCVVYAGDVSLWVAMLALLISAYQAIGLVFDLSDWPGIDSYRSGDLELVCVLASTLAALIFVYRLIIAYWRYLEFRHVIATVLTTQFIVLLTVLDIAWLLSRLGSDR